MVFELFMELGASDEQLDFPTIYASAKAGYAVKEITDERKDMTPLFDEIIKQIPPPTGSGAGYLQMLVSNLDYSDYLGRIAYGRILAGRVSVDDTVVVAHGDGRRERGKVTALFGHQGMEKIELKHASAGDIIGLCGFEDVFIGETVTDQEDRPALHFVDIDPPTITMGILVNDGPLAGREGKLVTARNIRERLVRETRTNVSLGFKETDTAGSFELSARGEMQIAVLVEQMRREGFEVLVSRPEVIYKRDDNGNLLEPYETLTVDVPNDNLGDILQSLASRKAEITNMVHNPHSVLVEAVIPTRGLIGFETDLVNVTKGLGIASHLFKEYGPHKGEIPSRGTAVCSSRWKAASARPIRWTRSRSAADLFIGAQEEIYEGMIIGENARPDDLPVNPCKAKKLNNMRSQGDGKGVSASRRRW